jgi:hypothetical protein
VTTAYLQYVSNNARFTAIGEFLAFRGSVLRQHKICWNNYTALSEKGDLSYTSDRLSTLRVLASELGCIESEDGMMIMETGDEGPGEITTGWLIEAYFSLKN